MFSKRYLCGNEHPPDPCNYAKEGYKIPREEAIRSMDDTNVLLCPGKTESGKDCRSSLIPLPDPIPCWKKLMLPSAGLLAMLLLVWIVLKLLPSPAPPSILVEPDSLTFSGTTNGRIKVSNQGEEELVITQIQAFPSQFTTTEKELQVKQGKPVTMFVNFNSASAGVMKGELTFYTNDPEKSSFTIPLVVQPESITKAEDKKKPWWVYQQLDITSNILRAEP